MLCILLIYINNIIYIYICIILFSAQQDGLALLWGSQCRSHFKVCVCVCARAAAHTHTHTHTLLYMYRSVAEIEVSQRFFFFYCANTPARLSSRCNYRSISHCRFFFPSLYIAVSCSFWMLCVCVCVCVYICSFWMLYIDRSVALISRFINYINEWIQ